ncbi:hypothetical protein PybrP1_012407 [[Pythium] brassicae (nom. inval.)]|nr:hypothetical protein PybrP1_012407 [[Pythium] brassicae (nom. inval.)]
MVYQAVVEKDYATKLFKIAVVHKSTYDSEMTRVANMVSEHACSPVYGEHSLAVGRAKCQYFEALPNIYFIKSVATEDDARD